MLPAAGSKTGKARAATHSGKNWANTASTSPTSRTEATAIANAFTYARSEVDACKTEWSAIKSTAASNNWSISPTGQLSGQLTERNRADFDTLQRRLTKLMTEADRTDRDLATAVRAVVGDTKLTPDGRPIYWPTHAEG